MSASIDKDELREQIQDMFVRFFDGQMSLANQLTSGSVSVEEALTGKETTTNYAMEVESLISAQITTILDRVKLPTETVPENARTPQEADMERGYNQALKDCQAAIHQLRQELSGEKV